jgi:hypothetical protein
MFMKLINRFINFINYCPVPCTCFAILTLDDGAIAMETLHHRNIDVVDSYTQIHQVRAFSPPQPLTYSYFQLRFHCRCVGLGAVYVAALRFVTAFALFRTSGTKKSKSKSSLRY